MTKPPDPDLARVRSYCEAQVPAEFRDQIRVEYRVRGGTVTLVECRPGWNEHDRSEWTDLEQARMKYDATTGGWTLYWFDRNSKAHRYDLLEPDQPIQRLLDEVEADPTCIFKG